MDTNETICFKHMCIKDSARRIKRGLKKNPLDIENLLYLVDCILKDVRITTRMGQKMETRLLKYRNSIENLGFTRKKRIKS